LAPPDELISKNVTLMHTLLSLLRWREQANPPMVASLIALDYASDSSHVMSKQVLIVDDEPNVRLAYRMTLEAEGMAVHQADGAAAALEKLSTIPIDLAILDLRMPEMDGLELLAEIRNRGHATPVVIITAYGEVPHAVRAMKLGAIDFLEKPLTPELLRGIVEEVFARHMPVALPPRPSADDFGTHFSEAKRLINLQTFGTAWTHLSRALELSPGSPAALNLAGVLFEMQGDYQRAGKLYEKAIQSLPNFAPARQNIRRLVDYYESGSSNEPFDLGN
jgi:DNA-binding response OmpR family regulator